MTLTPRQKAVYDFIGAFLQENGFAPSYQEIANGVGVVSVRTVHQHMVQLEARGYIRRRKNCARSLELVSQSPLPLAVEAAVCAMDDLLESMIRRELELTKLLAFAREHGYDGFVQDIGLRLKAASEAVSEAKRSLAPGVVQ